MASYSQLYVHCVWATWDRLPLILSTIEIPLYAVIADTCYKLGCQPYAIGGIVDHVHVLVRFSPIIPITELVQHIKGASSHAVTHAIQPNSFFKWQGSYGAFTISKRSVSRVSTYISNQKIHHANKTLINALEYCVEPDTASNT